MYPVFFDRRVIIEENDIALVFEKADIEFDSCQEVFFNIMLEPRFFEIFWETNEEIHTTLYPCFSKKQGRKDKKHKEKKGKYHTKVCFFECSTTFVFLWASFVWCGWSTTYRTSPLLNS